MGKRFGLLGLAGYIAPRHLRAIRDTGGELVSACDPCDSVGIMDSYFPDCHFYTDFAVFEAYNRALKARGEGLDWVSVCTPNHLHLPHASYGMRLGADVICEKPLTLSLDMLDAMGSVERETGRRVYTILQLRLHESIRRLREKVLSGPADRIYDVDLTYITARGNWYFESWKGEERKSGGIATNIGVHLFDMLTWIFGNMRGVRVHVHTPSCCAGILDLARARVRFFLSIDAGTLPAEAVEGEKRTYRAVRIDGEEFEFSVGFTELHTESYRQILAGQGYGVEDVRACIGIVEGLRHADVLGVRGDYHPYARGM